MTPQETKSQLVASILGGLIGSISILIVATVVVIASQDQIKTHVQRWLETSSVQTQQNVLTTEAATVTDGEGAREQLLIDMIKQVSPSVVSVTLTKEVPVYEQYYEEDSYDPFQDFFGSPSPFGDLFQRRIPQQRAIGNEQIEIGGGTGFLISTDGYIVTNRHVVDQEGVEYTVITDDGTEHPATIVAKDPVFDIAVLKIDGEDFPALTFGDSDEVEVGQTVIAIGNALAEFRNTVSVGVVSGLSRSVTAGDGYGHLERLEGVIQTDAAINPGNSGGPLIDLNGHVIGVNVAMAGAENIGFALPSNMVRKVSESVQQNGSIVRPFLGIRYIQINETLKEKNNLSVDYGVLVIRGEAPGELAVTPGSAADKAGITENDILLEFDGTKLDEEHRLANLIRAKDVGETVQVKILSKGEEQTINVTLEAFPE
ncbi:PDZ domain-containing protein [Candidatus Uhrbacteria bacterium]|nr:PDZ domain-containing protein [Candidatus Uhrbacteria bacterium]MBD3284347.1 PDZ domain-containing protein [Candidatus Uhrbacteria bacterium]